MLKLYTVKDDIFLESRYVVLSNDILFVSWSVLDMMFDPKPARVRDHKETSTNEGSCMS